MKPFKEPVFFIPAKNGIVPQTIDLAIANCEKIYVGMHSGETQEQINARYPGVQLGELESVIATKEAMMKSGPIEITRAQYVASRDVLPPEDWQRDASGSSFKMCEHLSGRITSIYAVVDDRCFTFKDVYSLTHQEIMAMVLRVAKADVGASA